METPVSMLLLSVVLDLDLIETQKMISDMSVGEQMSEEDARREMLEMIEQCSCTEQSRYN